MTVRVIFSRGRAFSEVVARTMDGSINPALDRDLAAQAVEEGMRRYFAERRARVVPFIDRHFSLRGALRVHRHALGWDIVKAPLNLTLAAPQVLLRLVALIVGRTGPKRLASALAGRTLLLPTAVASEIEWLIRTELLELPFRQEVGGRVREAAHDALAEAIIGGDLVTAALARSQVEIASHGDAPEFRARLRRALGEYAGTRAAAAEITTGMLSMGAGAALVSKLTPGAATLGPALAALLAQQAAVSSFPLGAGLGGIWYAMFPVGPTVAMTTALTAGLMLSATTFSAFAGIVADPVQRRLGLHRRRLLRLIAALERQAFEPGAQGFTVHDHYVARLLDVFDFVTAALRVVRG